MWQPLALSRTFRGWGPEADLTPDLSACAYGACPSFDEAGVGGVWGGPLRRQPLARVFFLLPSGCRNGTLKGSPIPSVVEKAGLPAASGRLPRDLFG